MRVRIQRERPDPWSIRREHRCLSGASNGRWIGLPLSISTLKPSRYDSLKQKHYQAWQVINTAQGKGGSGGRIEALPELNHDRTPLVGVDGSGAFLQNLRLEHARLLRSNCSAADLRDSRLNFADFSDANLHAA